MACLHTIQPWGDVLGGGGCARLGDFTTYSSRFLVSALLDLALLVHDGRDLVAVITIRSGIVVGKKGKLALADGQVSFCFFLISSFSI